MPRWTPEARRKQAEAIKKWQPWKQSTGPKTEEGKAKSSQNALKHGGRSAELRSLKRALAQLEGLYGRVGYDPSVNGEDASEVFEDVLASLSRIFD